MTNLPRIMIHHRLILGLLTLAAAAPATGLRAQAVEEASSQLKKLSLEELLALEVTSVSRRPERASHAAAAVEVITAEQIASTGAASLQDALRLATGLQVSQFGGHSYAISSRGFTSLAANKLQVMQDGRSLYSPLFSGVFWDGYGALLEDLDRIEVIRGPGATMWGANAVNGVISIVTRDASETQGALVSAGGGSYERLFGALRYGGAIGTDTHYRIYARAHDRGGMSLPNGQEARAAPLEQQAGFRADSHLGGDNHFTLQGDHFRNESETGGNDRARNRSTNLLGRWVRGLGADSDVQVQAYADRFARRVPGQIGSRHDTFDLDLQYRQQAGGRHHIIAGLNYRTSSDRTEAGGTTQFLPRERTVENLSVFAQDEVAVVPERFAVVLGAKAQWNTIGGFELQPNVRAAWTPGDRQTLWAAVSRAVRMPSRIDSDLRFIPVPASGVVAFQGNPDFEPERLTAFEVGYRVRPMERVYVDVTVFHHEYDRLRSLEPTPVTVLPFVQYNLLDAETSGVEGAVKFELADWWRVSGNYSHLRRRLQPEAASRDPNRGTLEGNDASRLYSVWSSMDLPARLTLDLVVRHVGALPAPVVPSYTELDARIGWRPSPGLELSVSGRNLLDPQHLEFGTASPATAEVERSWHAKATWQF